MYCKQNKINFLYKFIYIKFKANNIILVGKLKTTIKILRKISHCVTELATVSLWLLCAHSLAAIQKSSVCQC